MRHRIALLLLAASFCVTQVGVAQRSDIQPVQWILQEAAASDMWAYIAPDGETITFSRTTDKRNFELLATDTKGSPPRPFLTAPAAPSQTRGAWSRPHRRLAFTGNAIDGSDFGIYVADANGANITRVPIKNLSGLILYPSWLPDGRSVVIVNVTPEGGNTLYRVDLASGESAALTDLAKVLPGMPAVSPDGKVVAFAGQLNAGQKYDQTRNEIWVMPIGGGEAKLVSGGQGRQPDWSPDGRWLAFASGRGDPAGKHAVFVVDGKGRHLTQLTDYGVNAQHPVWSPDGKWLVFSAQVGDDPYVFGLARINVPKLPK